MVKNTTGGGRTKGLARKHQRAQQTSSHLRIPEEEGEEIGYIKKMLGNGMCEAISSLKLLGVTFVDFS